MLFLETVYAREETKSSLLLRIHRRSIQVSPHEMNLAFSVRAPSTEEVLGRISCCFKFWT